MITRFILLLLLGSSFLASVASAGPSVQLVVPTYDYPRADATLGNGIANNKTIVGNYVYRGDYGYLRMSNGRFGPAISVAGAIETDANGVNNSGLVCGTFTLGGNTPPVTASSTTAPPTPSSISPAA